MGIMPSLNGRRIGACAGSQGGEGVGRDGMNKMGWLQNTSEAQRIGAKCIRSHEGPIMWEK